MRYFCIWNVRGSSEQTDSRARLNLQATDTVEPKNGTSSQVLRRIEEALQTLPEKHRAILLLREVEGMSYEDLARTLDVPKGMVMSRLFHARAKMQKILSEYLEIDVSEPEVGTE